MQLLRHGGRNYYALDDAHSGSACAVRHGAAGASTLNELTWLHGPDLNRRTIANCPRPALRPPSLQYYASLIMFWGEACGGRPWLAKPSGPVGHFKLRTRPQLINQFYIRPRYLSSHR